MAHNECIFLYKIGGLWISSWDKISDITLKYELGLTI